MIVEGAFFKLPELMVRYKQWVIKGVHEYTLHGSFVMALLTELNARNAPNPMQYIILEQPYPKNKRRRCDVYVRAPPVFQSAAGLGKMGFKQHNYIEIKLFYDYKGRKSYPKVEKVGQIIDDLLRLLNYTNENDGKYLLIAFNRNKERFLAFNKGGGKERIYLKKLFSAGRNKIEIDLNNEPSSLCNKVDKGFKNKKHMFWVTTMPIETIKKGKGKINYSFYLIRIDEKL